MSMTFLNQLSIIPALLIALTGLFMLRGQEAGKTERRLLFYSLGMGVLILLALFITLRFVTEPYDQPFFQLSNLLAPSLSGLTVLIILNLKALAKTDTRTRIAGTLACLAMVVLFGLLWSSQLGVGYLILPGALILAIGWALGRRYGWLVIILGLFSLGIFYLFNQLLNHPPDYNNNPPSSFTASLFFIAFYVVPALSVVMSAVMITTSLQSFSMQTENATVNHPRRLQWIKIGFAFMLLLYLAYTIFWGSVWDQTSDGLFGIFFMETSAMVAIGAGMLMILALHGKYRIAGLLFVLVVPSILYQSFEAGWRVSYHEMTENRATRIAWALERFQGREGHYPKSLNELTPRDLIFIQQPVILAGEEWCYEGNDNSYRLSAFYREFFSAPVSLRVYESAGEFPAGSSFCEERLVKMKEKYYSPMEDPSAMQPPIPTPLPENEVGIPKTEIRPLLNGAVALPGSWSPDSTYFVFGTQTSGLTLHFLNGITGEVCTADEQFSSADSIREYHTWLPDGRLLYVDPSGRMIMLTPCQLGGEQLDDRFPVSFTQVAAIAQQGNRLLLQSENAYWILDERTLTATPIPNLTPVPFEFHWDNFAWLPGGEKLVIARLNGRKGSDAGSTLYMIDGGTGDILQSISLDGEFGQSAPWVEGLSDHEVLMNGIGEWLMIDFSTDPPVMTNVLADIFGLDVKFSDEISASGSFVHPDGNGYYLAVRLNHPRNQGTYLYDSQSGEVRVYNHEYHTLLLFPNGYLMEMAKLEDVPTYQDEYDMVWVDQPETTQPRLKLNGHTPREYPHLSLVYLVNRSQVAAASAQGVSLVSLPDGKMDAYWELIGDGYSPWLIAAPNGSALVATKDFGGLYYIPLPPDQ